MTNLLSNDMTKIPQNREREVLAIPHVLVIQKPDQVQGILMPGRIITSPRFVLTSPAITPQ
jgi:hypothetical protein